MVELEDEMPKRAEPDSNPEGDISDVSRWGLLDDDAYRRARLLVLMVYAITSSATFQSRATEPGATSRQMRRAAVATGAKAIRAHEGECVQLGGELGALGSAVALGEREGWLSESDAGRMRALSAAIAAPA